MTTHRTYVCLVDPSESPEEVTSEIVDLAEDEFQQEDSDDLEVKYDKGLRELLMELDASIEHTTGYNEPALVGEFGFFINEESFRTIIEMARDYETILLTIQSMDMAYRLKNSIQGNQIGIVHPLGWIRGGEADQNADFYLQEVEWWDQLPTSITTHICNGYDALAEKDFDSCILYSIEAVERAVIHTYDHIWENGEEKTVREKLSNLEGEILEEIVTEDIKRLFREEKRVKNEGIEPEIGEAQVVFYTMLNVIQNMHRYLVNHAD